MRIVAGSARGLRIEAPPGRSTRPTSDRVREAVFNALGSLDAVRGARVLDLFAGSGALGLEALSRGADHATFVDTDPRALDVVRSNIEHLGVADRSTVVRADALAFVRTMEPVDVALCDPPYAFDGWTALLDELAADLVVAESDRELDLPDGWDATRVRRYGGTLVTVAQRRTPSE
ncbi:MAG TPA: 16S rRNA (guanine(966)-N(2))-methyltransferase RsmD [Acidimicrobiales bacterium]|nr:16S rRNA (guanine(966)-N(2))-methyltransferase RsmD [Acidimicrobiales bacterium]